MSDKAKKKAPLTQEEKKERKEKRRLIKAEKKKKKVEKKLAKENRYILYDPEKMQAFRLSQFFGYFLRFFAIAFSVFGVCILVCDAFLLTEVDPFILLAYCVAMVSAFSLMFIGGYRIFAGLGILGAYVGLFFAFFGNILTFYVSGSEALINRVMKRLSDRGFAAIDSVSFPDFGGVDSEIVIYGGIFALATVLSLIFAAFSAKQTRVLPMAIFGGGLCVVCFTYNLCNSNWGIACVLAGLCSAIVLSAHDKIYKKHKKSKKSRAYSGYSAAIAGILAIIMLLAPTVAIKDEFMEIEAISDEIEYARTIITTILTGGNPKYNKMNTLNKETSAKIQDFTPTGAHLFTVGSGSSKRNVYLRSWIGDDYSLKSDSWSLVDEDEYKKMLKEVQGESNGFTGDDVTMLLYQLADKNSTSWGITNDYYSSTTYGYLSTYINVEYVKNTGLLYVLPSSYNSLLGLLEFESRHEEYNQSYSIVSDGIARSSWLNLKKSYSAVAVLPTYIESNYAENAEKLMLYYNLLAEFTTYKYQEYSSNEAAIRAFEAILEQNSIKVANSSETLREFLKLSPTEKKTWQRKNIQLINSYTQYVNSYYTRVTPTEGLTAVYNEILPLVEQQTTTHGKLMCVVDYLVKNYEYSLTPTSPSGRYSSDIDSFLLETKNGYCVQFATSATLLFRMLGYPARYVQGYVASDFNDPEYYMTDEERKAYKEAKENGDFAKLEKDGYYESPYVSQVTDEDAHAWVEVYIDGLGWRTYEPTPVYYTNIYEYKNDLSDALDKFEEEETPPEDEVTDTTTTTTTQEPDTEPDTEEELPEPVFTLDTKMLVTTLIILIVGAGIAVIVVLHVRKVMRIVQARGYFIERAIYGSFESDADKNKVASVLCDSIYEIHYIIGNRPRVGEDPTQFAARIDAPDLTNADKAELQKHRRAAMRSHTLSQITVLVQKHEFGKALSRDELATLGEYLNQLLRDEYGKLNLFKKIYYRYFKFMI